MKRRTRTFLVDHGLQRIRSRNDGEYLFGNAENAARLERAIADCIAGRTVELTLDQLYARYGLAREHR
jgi:hypothetical protein